MSNRKLQPSIKQRTLRAEQLDERRVLAAFAPGVFYDADQPDSLKREFSPEEFRVISATEEVSRWDSNPRNKIHSFEANSAPFANREPVAVYEFDHTNVQASLMDIEDFVDAAHMLSLDHHPLPDLTFDLAPPVESRAETWSDGSAANIAFEGIASAGRILRIPSINVVLDVSQLATGWAFTQSATEHTFDAKSGFQFSQNRFAEMSGDRFDPLGLNKLTSLVAPRASNLARVISYLSQQFSTASEAFTRPATQDFATTGRYETSTDTAHLQQTPAVLLDHGATRSMSPLAQRRTLSPHDDAEGGLLEISSGTKTASRNRTVSASIADKVLESRDENNLWVEFFETILDPRPRTAAKSKVISNKPASDDGVRKDPPTSTDEGGMIELTAPVHDTTVAKTTDLKNGNRNRIEHSTRLEAGVSFYREFDLSTSPMLEKLPDSAKQPATSKELSDTPNTGESTGPSTHSAAIVPFVAVGLALCQMQKEDPAETVLRPRRRPTRSR